MTTFIRKRDGKLYRSGCEEQAWPRREHLGPCYLLHPVWGLGGVRSHYKTVAAFKREYTNEDGSAIE